MPLGDLLDEATQMGKQAMVERREQNSIPLLDIYARIRGYLSPPRNKQFNEEVRTQVPHRPRANRRETLGPYRSPSHKE